MNRRYIAAVKPLRDYVLQIVYVSNSRLLLNMRPYLDKLRFRPVADKKIWESVETDGVFVRFGDVELSHDELLEMAEYSSTDRT